MTCRTHTAYATPSGPQFEAAVVMVRLGLSVLPIVAGGSKKPARRWKPLQGRLPVPAEILDWFGPAAPLRGLAVVTGGVSGGLATVDADTKDVAAEFAGRLAAARPDVLARLVTVESPRGRHYHFRVPGRVRDGRLTLRNAKLAMAPDTAARGGRRTLIDLKGEGGYCIAPPTPGACHPTGRPYRFAGPLGWHALPEFGDDEVEAVLAAARGCNRWQPPPKPAVARPLRVVASATAVNRWPPPPRAAVALPQRPPSAARPGRPGDDIDVRADWATVLEPHGWRLVGVTGGEGRWRRPGKGEGHSATTDHAGSGRLVVFTTNAPPFETGRGYTRFQAYALLEHGGDHAAAARALRAAGYGRLALAGLRDRPAARSLVLRSLSAGHS